MDQEPETPKSDDPKDPMAEYLAKQEERRLSKLKPKRDPKELFAARQAQARHMLEKRKAKQARKDEARRKVEAGEPITEEERDLLSWVPGAGSPRTPKDKETKERFLIAASAKLMLRPQSVNELRLLVETTAAKHHYNPIEALIEQTRSVNIDEKDKISIHKALLPFLVPQLATPKPGAEDPDKQGIKVVVTHFQFPSHTNTQPEEKVHTQPPAMVQVESVP